MNTQTRAAWLMGGSSAALAAALAVTSATPANAQATANPASPPATSEVVVTGSRIARTGFTTPTPVTVISQEQIGREAATNVAAVIQELPAFRPVSSPISISANNQNVGASTADLRGLGANRTLVLVDGQRFVGSTVAAPGQVAADAVDLNLLPTSMLLRADVVTGGASASYGSDAVAGVLNVILDNKLTGLKLQTQYSETTYGNSIEYQISGAYGRDVLGGKGHFVVSGEYVDNKGVDSRLNNGRNWSTQENLNATVQNPCVAGVAVSALCPTGNNGLPANIVTTNPENALYSVGGLIMSGPGKNLVFNTPAAAVPYQFGYYLGKGNGMAGGQGPNSFNENFPFEAPVRHYALYGHGDYDFNEFISGHVSVNYGDSKSAAAGVQPRFINAGTTSNSTTLVIQGDNAFLPAAVASMYNGLINPATGTRNPTNFSLGLLYDAFGPVVQATDRNTIRAVGSLDGKFNLIGDKAWTWSAYYQYGKSDYHLTATNALKLPQFFAATDAVTVTPANVGTSGLAIGSIACRTTLTAPTNGCTPLNPFGNLGLSGAQRTYTTGTQTNSTSLVEQVVSGQVQGDLFTLPAGPVTLAFGGEYRTDSISGTEDPLSAAGQNGYQVVTTIIANGSNNIKEGYAELAVPVLKDVLLARNLNFDGAVRYSDYNTTGGVVSWKLGLVDDLTDWLRVRGTWSQDIRGPNVWDLYQSQLLNQVAGNDPLTGQNLIPQDTGGNPNLKPEIAYTFTGGFVVTAPANTWFSGLRFSADYYHIKVNDAITSVSANTTLNNCEVKNSAAACALITRNASAGVGLNGIPFITLLQASEVNIASITSTGVDVELDYRKPLSELPGNLPGTIDFHLLGSHTMELTQNIVGVLTYGAGVNGQEPWWRLNGSLTYNLGNLTVGGTGRFISDQIGSSTSFAPCQGAAYTAALAVPNETNTTSSNCIGSYAIFGLNANYTFDYQGGKISLYGTIDNIFDRPPPFATGGFASGVGPAYDLLGRNFHMGVRLRF